MYRKEIIEVVILFAIFIGIVLFTVFTHMGISQSEASALVTKHVQKEFNLSSSEISVLNVTPTTVNGTNVFKVNVTFMQGNETLNKTYLVDADNGTISLDTRPLLKANNTKNSTR